MTIHLFKKASYAVFGIALIVFLFNTMMLFSQHCPWDGSQVMVFEIKAAVSDSESIQHLKLTITDTSGTTIMEELIENGKKTETPLAVFDNRDFKMNLKEKANDPRLIRLFWFAGNHYVLVASIYSFNRNDLVLTIEDIDKGENGGYFKQAKYPIDSIFAFPLCTRYSRWDIGPSGGFVENFKPVTILLDRMEDNSN